MPQGMEHSHDEVSQPNEVRPSTNPSNTSEATLGIPPITVRALREIVVCLGTKLPALDRADTDCPTDPPDGLSDVLKLRRVQKMYGTSILVDS